MVAGIVAIAACLALVRLVLCLVALASGQPDEFLAFPLAVILPLAALAFLALQKGTKSAEGALMRLAAMLLILLVLAIPPFALHLALGFPVAFLVVELFETRFPAKLRDAVKRSVMA